MHIFLNNFLTERESYKNEQIRHALFARFLGVSFAVLFVAVSLFAGMQHSSYAQESSPATKQEEIEKLKKELEELQRQLQENRAQEEQYRSERRGYSRDISILENQIYGIQLEMQRVQLTLQQTGLAIEVNKETIEELNEKIDRQKELMGNILLNIYKMDKTSAIEIILSSDTLSEFFADVHHIKSLQSGLSDALEQVKLIKEDIEEEKIALEQKVDEQASNLQVQQAQRMQLNSKINEKEELLAASQSKEEEYKERADNAAKTISEVRNQLFRLEGAGVAVTFEEAYNHAKSASDLTGVRPALLLSVLKQESSWGANVGQCYLVNVETGMGRGANSGNLIPRIMRADSVRNDVQKFLQITDELGRDPFQTRVSCWIPACVNNAITVSARPTIGSDGSISCPAHTPYPFGYGGAIGPAQFLPTVWMGYRDRVSSLLGRTADPWLISDAFLASAVKLSAAGASKGTYDAEWCSAMIYYSGRCSSGSVNDFYANQVMARASEYQRDIDILEGR